MRVLHALLLFVAFTPQLAAASTPAAAPQVDTKASSVTLDVTDNRDTPAGKGFLISIGSWKPSGLISIYLAGPQGESIAILPKERGTKVSPEGTATIEVPYELRGLYSGQWQLVVAGDSGIHLATVSVP